MESVKSGTCTCTYSLLMRKEELMSIASRVCASRYDACAETCGIASHQRRIINEGKHTTVWDKEAMNGIGEVSL